MEKYLQAREEESSAKRGLGEEPRENHLLPADVKCARLLAGVAGSKSLISW